MSKERAAQLVDAGVWLKLSGDVDGARRLFERALHLDPENAKARQLLEQPGSAMTGVEPPAAGANPFEPAEATPSATERDWSLATSSPSSLTDDWGGLIGPATPKPQRDPSAPPTVQPVQPGSLPPPALSPPTANKATLNFSRPSEVDALAPPLQKSSLSTLLFSPSGVAEDPRPAPASSPSTLLFSQPSEVQSAPPASDPSAQFARPSDVFEAAPARPVSSPSNALFFQMPDEVRAALAGGPAEPPPSPEPLASSPSQVTTMQFAMPEPAAAAQPPDDEWGRITDEAEEISLERHRPSRIAPLPPMSKPPARSSKSGVTAAPPPTPGDDWGQLTVDLASTADTGSSPPTSQPSLPPPPAFASTPSQSTLQFAMPNEVRGPAPTASSSPSGTFAFAMPQAVRDALPPPGPHPVAKTISLSGELPSLPDTITLSGEARPQAPVKATPPLFPPSNTVVLDGAAPPPSPPHATPPMFSDAPDPLAAFSAEVPPGLQPKAEPPQAAWQWRSQQTAEPLVPRPSPRLAPAAQSAWDQRSNPGIQLDAMAEGGSALDLLSSDSKITRDPTVSKRDEVKTILRSARDLLDLDDHTGAMELISKAESLAPDHPEVQELKARSGGTLLAMYESKLGRMDKVPRVLLKDDEIIWLNLDHRAGFVLAQIDGSVTFEDLFAVSGMSRIDTARILAQLVDEGVISRG